MILSSRILASYIAIGFLGCRRRIGTPVSVKSIFPAILLKLRNGFVKLQLIPIFGILTPISVRGAKRRLFPVTVPRLHRRTHYAIPFAWKNVSLTSGTEIILEEHEHHHRLSDLKVLNGAARTAAAHPCARGIRASPRSRGWQDWLRLENANSSIMAD